MNKSVWSPIRFKFRGIVAKLNENIQFGAFLQCL